MVKIVDVAREAGVAPSTVSRALNHHPSVAPEYLERVRRAADKLGYRPNGAARSLRRQRGDVLALIIPDVGNHFCTAVTRGVEDVARAAGLSLLLCNSDEDRDKEATYLDVVIAEQVAGVLISPHDSSVDVSRLGDAGIPVVAIDRPLASGEDAVLTDGRAGAETAVQHLLRAGWSRPACCAGPSRVDTAARRLEGYIDAVTAAGTPPLVAHGSYDREGGRHAARRLLDADTAPDALFVSNEQMALGVLAELADRQLVPGRDIGVVTFDDTPWAPLVTPPITVVEQPAYEVGKAAARMLIERIEDGAPRIARQTLLPTRLIVRESSLRHP